MSSREFAEWMAYEQVAGPLGAERGDIHTALLAAMIHNVNVKSQHRKKPVEFLPEWDRQGGRRQSPEEMLAMLRAITGAQGKGRG